MSTVATPSDLVSLSAYGKARSTVTGTPLSTDELRKTDAYWRACNYLSLGMIYLHDNPLLTEPLRPEHIKNRLLGHWGSSPGLVVYLHPPEPADQEIRPGHDLPGRTGARRPWRSRSGLSGGNLLRGLSGQERRLRKACASSSSSSRFPAASAATARRKHRAQSMKAANWATCFLTPAAPPSTIPT